ncbi:recombination regulator RecX [Mycobacterium sp. MYCO198283]|uniref:recombination regulator RecX n=1 Tax=Mycobacterium sp. MYCO198283 TaxID=2883505 RepID=UPI001E3830DD|nr:recombination regulator RecX [Mycobacterium sp. MYCO198283]MCG5433852.1 recombination regulator RecX [Mycobacterium sp. MYCO198283]
MTSCPPPSTSDDAKREEQARNVCLRLLTARARTRSELEEQLAKRGYANEVTRRVLDRLADVGLIDDAAFAEQWVRSRRQNSGKGKRALVAELKNKGVDDEVISAVIEDVDPAAWRSRAEELVAARLRRENLDGDALKVMRRLVGMLVRRGYHPSMAHDVVRTALDLELERRRT